MTRRSNLTGLAAFCAFASWLALSVFARAATDDSVAQSDAALVQALERRDHTALAKILDTNFIWIDSHGRRLSRADVLHDIPYVANAGVEIESRIYGGTAVVHANRGKMNVLRIYIKRGSERKAVLYQEVLQVEKSEPAGGKPSTECVNPCKTIPFKPETQSEKDAIASWQGVMRAMAENDPEAYAPLIAEEFTATDTYHDRPYNKADRLAQISKQKAGGVRSSPPELLAAEMFDFGDCVMMVAKEQRPGARSYFNTRLWTRRDARWQMVVSFNTRIE